MVNTGNGRKVNIPVRKSSPQLPAEDKEPRPLLDKPERKAGESSDSPAKAIDWQDRALRLQADAENARKRAERRAQERIAGERRRILGRMLSVVDNLERALAHAPPHDPLRAGVELTLNDLLTQLAQEGVKPIEALGQPFDPHLHEAVSSDGSGGDRVIKVLETGYTLDGVLLRPARVIVGQA